MMKKLRGVYRKLIASSATTRKYAHIIQNAPPLVKVTLESSSGSWSPGPGGAGDILNIDRFVRIAVRPPHTGEPSSDHLVVDAGGGTRKPVVSRTSSENSRRHRRHHKLYSQDSGVSDPSYTCRPHKNHKRAEGGGGRSSSSRALTSSASLKAFRAACERTLREQQGQIARVAELCERIAEQRSEPAREPRPRAEPRRDEDSDSSDLSSSSRSTRDLRRRDRHRTEECKTYKIIMSKLDELSRLFGRPRAPPRAAPSDVSVRDKLTATEPHARTQWPSSKTAQVQISQSKLIERGVGSRTTCDKDEDSPPQWKERDGYITRLSAINAHAISIAPEKIIQLPNIHQEKVIKFDSGSECTFDEKCTFNMSAYHATRCSRSQLACERDCQSQYSCGRARRKTLCAVCRNYWRAVRRCVISGPA